MRKSELRTQNSEARTSRGAFGPSWLRAFLATWLILLSSLPALAAINVPTDIANCNLWLKAGVGQFDATVAGNAVTTDGGAIARWEDQSGAGKHATQATAGNRPLYDALKTAVCTREGALHFLTLPGSYSLDRQSFSLYFISRYNNCRTHYNTVGPGSFRALYWGGNSLNLYYSTFAGPLQVSVYNGAANQDTALKVRTVPTLIGMRGDASALIVDVNDQAASMTALSAGTVSGGNLFGEATGTWDIGGSHYEVIGYSRKLSNTEVGDLLAYAKAGGAKVRLSAEYGTNLLLDGDSITSGVGSTLNRNYAQAMLRIPAQEINTGEASKQLTTLIGEAATFVDPFRESVKQNALFLFAGTNDLALGSRTTTQVYNDTKTYGDARRAAGWSGAKNIVCIVGILPRPAGGTYSEANRQTIRTSIRADFGVATGLPNIYRANTGVTYGDYYIDLAADATMGPDGSQNNATYFADTVHPTTAGYAIVAGYTDQVMRLAFMRESNRVGLDIGVGACNWKARSATWSFDLKSEALPWALRAPNRRIMTDAGLGN